ncbi:MAG: hypothetical protein JXX14_19145, partial [Deltaproteobacteria bacterium]|nr:hypothetical protein [Deltaproteobacteria bacterium]
PTTHDQVVEMIVPKNRSDRAKQKRKRRIEQPSPVSKSGGKDVGNLSSNPYRLRKNPFKTE